MEKISNLLSGRRADVVVDKKSGQRIVLAVE